MEDYRASHYRWRLIWSLRGHQDGTGAAVAARCGPVVLDRVRARTLARTRAVRRPVLARCSSAPCSCRGKGRRPASVLPAARTGTAHIFFTPGSIDSLQRAGGRWLSARDLESRLLGRRRTQARLLRRRTYVPAPAADRAGPMEWRRRPSAGSAPRGPTTVGHDLQSIGPSLVS
jgi:hypothetical protein